MTNTVCIENREIRHVIFYLFIYGHLVVLILIHNVRYIYLLVYPLRINNIFLVLINAIC